MLRVVLSFVYSVSVVRRFVQPSRGSAGRRRLSLCVLGHPVVLDHVHPLAALLRPLLCPHVKVRFAHERFFVVIAEANS